MVPAGRGCARPGGPRLVCRLARDPVEPPAQISAEFSVENFSSKRKLGIHLGLGGKPRI